MITLIIYYIRDMRGAGYSSIHGAVHGARVLYNDYTTVHCTLSVHYLYIQCTLYSVQCKCVSHTYNGYLMITLHEVIYDRWVR